MTTIDRLHDFELELFIVHLFASIARCLASACMGHDGLPIVWKLFQTFARLYTIAHNSKTIHLFWNLLEGYCLCLMLGSTNLLMVCAWANIANAINHELLMLLFVMKNRFSCTITE